MMLKKRLFTVGVLILLVLSIFSIAEETVVSAAETPATVNECGFWCKINTFFFGSAENRAGKGWFDRKGALVGMGYVALSCASAGSNTFCKDSGKYYFKVSLNYWKNVKMDPSTLKLEATGDKFYQSGGTPSSDYSGTNSITVSAYVLSLQKAITKVADEAVELSSSAQSIKVEDAIKENNLESAKKEAMVADQNVVTANQNVAKAKEILSILKNLPGVTIEQITGASKKVELAEEGATLAAKNADKTALMVADAESKIETPVAGGPASTSSPPSTEGSGSSSDTGISSAPKPASASTFVYNPVISEDGTLTVQGPKVLHKYAPVEDVKLDGKQVYRYYEDNTPTNEYYVVNGDGFVLVSKDNNDNAKWKYNDGKGSISGNSLGAAKSELIGDEVTITTDASGKVTAATSAKSAAGVKDSKKAGEAKSTALATPQLTYTEIFSDSLGDNTFSKKIKEKYFDKDGLKKEYTYNKEAGTITKKNDKKVEETVLTLKTENSGIVKITDMILPTKEGETSTFTHTLLFSGQEIASQTEAQKIDGKATINGNTVLMEEDKFISDLDFIKQQLFYADEEDKSNGVVKSALQVGDDKITYTDADEETQTITDIGTDKKISQITELEGDWDEDDKEFTPSDGIIYEMNKKTGDKGKKKYLADYDYKDSKLDTVELFDPMSGKYKGATFAKLGNYEGVTMIQGAGGSIELEYKGEKSVKFYQDKDGNWKDITKTKNPTSFLKNTQDPSVVLTDTDKTALKNSQNIQTQIDSLSSVKVAEKTEKLKNLKLTRFSKEELTLILLKDSTTQEQIVKAMGYTSMDNYAKEKGIAKTEPIITPITGSEWTGKFESNGNIVVTKGTGTATVTHIYEQVGSADDKIIYQDKAMGIYVDADGNHYTQSGDSYAKQDTPTGAVSILGNYVTVNEEGKYNPTQVAEALAADQAAIQKAKEKQSEAEKQVADDPAITKQINDQHQSSAAQTAQTFLSSIYAAATSVKDYPAISKVLGISDWWKGVFEDSFMENFVTTADQTFAPMLGTNWFPSALCESHWDIEPEGTAMIKTPTGTYQAVAHIEGERSAQKSPILCSRNPDQEAEEEWLCDENQVCLEDGFCYADEDLNNKADDEEKQLTGYFYKITWGVSAPSDETFTPFIDEDGVAVSFNVVIKNTNKVEPLYNKEGDIDGPIELKNGDSDMDVILHYSPNLFTEVCIQWEHAPATVGEGFTGAFSGTEAIGDVCFDLVTSSVGEVNWESGGKPSSTKASDPKVSTNTGW